jgi:serine/threonine-protein kinase
MLEQARAEDVLRLFTDWLKQSDPRVLPGGDTMRVKAFLDGADAEISALESQPERQLRLRRVMADVRANRGEYARAELLLNTAIAHGRTALGPSHLEVIRARHSLARVIAAYRGQSFAAASFDSVVRALRGADGVSATEIASAYVDLATAIVDPARAQAMLDTAVQLRTQQQGDSLTIASTLDAEGEQFFKRGEFAQAATLFRAALRILDARLASDHFTRLSTLGNLAASENALANWTEAERLASEILRFERRSATGAEGVARALEELAVIHVNLGRYAQAESEERESIAALRSRKDATHELVDNSLRNLAIMQSAAGKPREGLALLDSVIANRRAARDSLQVAYLSAQRVPMLLRLGRTAEATAAVEAMERIVPTLALTSRMRGDAAVYSGMAAMAAGQVREATAHLAIATREFDKRYPVSHPRRALAHCAYGAALSRIGKRAVAATHLAACERHAMWGLADPTVVQWGRAALAP